MILVLVGDVHILKSTRCLEIDVDKLSIRSNPKPGLHRPFFGSKTDILPIIDDTVSLRTSNFNVSNKFRPIPPKTPRLMKKARTKLKTLILKSQPKTKRNCHQVRVLKIRLKIVDKQINASKRSNTR